MTVRAGSAGAPHLGICISEELHKISFFFLFGKLHHCKYIKAAYCLNLL